MEMELLAMPCLGGLLAKKKATADLQIVFPLSQEKTTNPLGQNQLEKETLILVEDQSQKCRSSMDQRPFSA